jgi:hypothetical protein
MGISIDKEKPLKKSVLSSLCILNFGVRVKNTEFTKEIQRSQSVDGIFLCALCVMSLRSLCVEKKVDVVLKLLYRCSNACCSSFIIFGNNIEEHP